MTKDYLVYIYWRERRCRTAAKLRWMYPGAAGGFQALDDAGYCLDSQS